MSINTIRANSNNGCKETELKRNDNNKKIKPKIKQNKTKQKKKPTPKVNLHYDFNKIINNYLIFNTQTFNIPFKIKFKKHHPKNVKLFLCY